MICVVSEGRYHGRRGRESEFEVIVIRRFRRFSQKSNESGKEEKKGSKKSLAAI